MENKLENNAKKNMKTFEEKMNNSKKESNIKKQGINGKQGTNVIGKKKKGKPMFFYIMLITYLFVPIVDRALFVKSVNFFIKILLRILPVFAIIWALMIVIDYFINDERIKKHIQSRGLKTWIIMIILGVLSSGAIYMWYPLLAELRKHGMSNGIIACFLYNRAVKVPLLPILIYYFGWKYVILLTILMIIFSVLQGVIVDLFFIDEINQKS